MPALAVIAAAAAGGMGFVPSKPTLTHAASTGQFTITNYDAALTYVLSATAGTPTRSGPTLSLSNANSIGTVKARGPKGLTDSAGGTAERKAYTYYSVHENVGECGPGPDCSCHPGYGPHWDTDPQLGSVNPHCSRDVSYKNSTPSGYTDSYSEWWKVG